MTDALDTLRPEAREALERMIVLCSAANKTGKWMRADCDTVIIAELLRLTDENARLLAANRDAMDHFEQMKAELAALTKKCTCSRRSVSSPFGCRVCNPQLEIADLESKLATSEAELAALKARIAEAPVASVRVDDRMHVSIGARSNAVDFVPLHTKHVALVKVEE